MSKNFILMVSSLFILSFLQGGCEKGFKQPEKNTKITFEPSPWIPHTSPDRKQSVPVAGGVHSEGEGNPAEELPEGKSDFYAEVGGGGPQPGNNGRAGGLSGEDYDADGAAEAPSAGRNNGSQPSEPRLIEEADIVKVVGDYLYVLNQWRGLQVIDLTTPDNPKLVARVPLSGYPIEMYVRDGNAYVLVSNYFSWWRAQEDGEDEPFIGSLLAIIDVSDPARPQWLNGIDLEGYVSDTRIVGDVLYAVSNRYSYYYYYGTEDNDDATVVMSVNISDPANVSAVDRLVFPRNGWNHHLNVTEDTLIIAATNSYWYNETSEVTGEGETEAVKGPYSVVQVVDISDPAGRIAVGKQFVVPGFLQDRWAMDLYDGTFRIATSNGWWGRGVEAYLRTYAMPSTDEVRFLAKMRLPEREALTAARFDGERGYIMSYLVPVRQDPLIVVDLSDPRHPAAQGEVHMPGWLDYAEPRGDRLVTLGRDDNGRKLTVGLYDVADPSDPKELGREIFGGNWTQTPADYERDDFQKVFKVLDDLQLIMVPYQAWIDDQDEYYYYKFRGGVQLLDYNHESIALRGNIETAGFAQRAVPFENRVVTISTLAMQVVDVSDRDAPAVKASLDLSRNVTQMAFAGGYVIEAVPPDWYGGNGRLTLAPESDPDTPKPFDVAKLSGYPVALDASGERAYVIDTDRGYNGLTLRVLDLSDAGNPVMRGSLALPKIISGYYYYWTFMDFPFERYPSYYYYGTLARAFMLDGQSAVLVATYYGRHPELDGGDRLKCLDCGEGEAIEDDEGNTNRWWNVFATFDLGDPDAPAMSSLFALKNRKFMYGMKAKDGVLMFSHSRIEEPEPGVKISRDWLTRLDLTNPAEPRLLPDVNIPGRFVDVSDHNRYIFTVEVNKRSFIPKTRFNSLALIGNTAYLRDTYEVEGIASGAVVRGGVAFMPAGLSKTWYDGGSGSEVVVQNGMILYMIDARVVRSLGVAGELVFGSGSDQTRLIGVEQGRALFQVGWDKLLVYDVSDTLDPQVWDTLQTQGYIQQVRAHGGFAYVSAGPYGLSMIELAPLAE